MIENLSKQKLHAQAILKKLKILFPEAKMFLNYRTPFELLVAVMLSAQCTDKKVNEVTPKLFEKYKTIDAYASASLSDLERLVYQAGFYKAKARHIKQAAQVVRDTYGGVLPKTIAEMISIPGVGRKTANVVLGNLYNVAEGVAVDTHVRRLVRVLGISQAKNIDAIERDLMKLYPKKEWTRLTYYFIEYGRAYCTARKHDERKCPLGHAHNNI